MRWLFILTLTSATPLWAIDPVEDLRIKETGKLFVVSVIPGKKQTQFFIAGKKAAEINVDNLQVSGGYMAGGKLRTFPLTRKGDSFVTDEPLLDKQIQLDIKEGPQTSETIRLELKRK